MPATATVVGLDFLILPSQDLKKAEAFYRDTLGLEVDSRWRDMGVEFKRADDLTLALVDQAKIGREFAPASSGSVALKVRDVHSALADLSAKGVEFHDVIDSGVCKMALFSDPDGNSLMLHHRYAPRARSHHPSGAPDPQPFHDGAEVAPCCTSYRFATGSQGCDQISIDKLVRA